MASGSVMGLDMPKPKGRKIAKRRVPQLQKAVAPAPMAKSDGWSSKGKTWLAIIVSVFGLVAAIAKFSPQISIEPSAPADRPNPFAGYMKITNDQFYPLSDVSVTVFSWCMRIGLGTNTSPVDRCDRSMPGASHRWSPHSLAPHEPYEITPGDVLLVTPPTALLYAQISVSVRYEPSVPAFPSHQRIAVRDTEVGRWAHRVATHTAQLSPSGRFIGRKESKKAAAIAVGILKTPCNDCDDYFKNLSIEMQCLHGDLPTTRRSTASRTSGLDPARTVGYTRSSAACSIGPCRSRHGGSGNG